MSNGVKFRRSFIIAIGVAAICFVVYRLISKASEKPPIRSTFQKVNVVTAKAKNTSKELVITLSGKLVAKNRIDLYSEVNGVLETANFREGNRYQRGQVLARINDTELRATIKSQKSALLNSIAQLLPDLAIDYPNEISKWKQFHDAISFENKIPELPEIQSDKLKVFVSAKNVFTNYYNIKAQEHRLTKHQIYAPFSGMLSSAEINTGTLVRAGQRLGTFIQPDVYELEASISLDELKYIKVGNSVSLTSKELNKSWPGTILRINESLDAATQSIKVYVGVTSKELKEGQYLTADVRGTELQNVIEVPRKYVLEGNEMYFIKGDSLLSKQQVDVVYKGSEIVYIQGVNDGTVYLNQVVNNAYDGMVVETLESKKAKK